jgi:hypothetical protein
MNRAVSRLDIHVNVLATFVMMPSLILGGIHAAYRIEMDRRPVEGRIEL